MGSNIVSEKYGNILSIPFMMLVRETEHHEISIMLICVQQYGPAVEKHVENNPRLSENIIIFTRANQLF